MRGAAIHLGVMNNGQCLLDAGCQRAAQFDVTACLRELAEAKAVEDAEEIFSGKGRTPISDTPPQLKSGTMNRPAVLTFN